MDGEDDDSRGRLGVRPWVVIGLLLAVAATTVLVFTDELRWLRLGIVAALWAALICAFLATRSFKHARANEQAVVDAQAVYELELEREIAARREHELQTETEIRRRVDAEAREELESLRAEVTVLRESLQRLFGGEVLYERVALTAQSTRMRQLGEEEPQVVSAAGANGSVSTGSDAAAPGRQQQARRALEPSAARESEQEQTNLLGVVPAQEGFGTKTGAPAVPSVPVPAPGQIPRADPPTRNVPAAQQRAPDQAPPPQAPPPQTPQPQPPQAPPPQTPPQTPQPQPQAPPGRVPPPQTPQAPAARPPAAEAHNGPGGAGQAQVPPKVPPAMPRPATQNPAGRRPEPQRQEPVQQAPYRPETQAPQSRPPAAGAPERADTDTPPTRGPIASRPQTNPASPPRLSAAQSQQVAEPTVQREPVPGPNPTMPDSATAIQHEGRQGGRRRRAAEEAADASPEPQPAEEADEQESGSHARGRSVNDLLAAHGASAASGTSRRRRGQD